MFGPNIYVNGTHLGVVDIFVYLGSTLSCDGSLDAEVQTRIGCVWKVRETFVIRQRYHQVTVY